MIFKYKFCLWLIDTLSIQPLTLPEIQKKWLNASANEDGDPLAERTFNRYRREAESLMYVDIKCDKRDGNLYKIIRPDGFKNDELQQWLLSAFRVSSLAERVNQREEVDDRTCTTGCQSFTGCDGGYRRGSRLLRIVYKSHYERERNHSVARFCSPVQTTMVCDRRS